MWNSGKKKCLSLTGRDQQKGITEEQNKRFIEDYVRKVENISQLLAIRGWEMV